LLEAALISQIVLLEVAPFRMTVVAEVLSGQIPKLLLIRNI